MLQKFFVGIFCLLVFSGICQAEVQKQRIISLVPSITEILFSLNLGDEIVAVTNYCNYPAQTRTKEKVGSLTQPDLEKIISLKPDLIFLSQEQSTIIKKLQTFHIKTFVSSPENIHELLGSIQDIGIITHRKNESQKLIQNMRLSISKIQEKVKIIPSEKRPKVFIEIWPAPLMTAGKGSFLNELIELAGGKNIASDVRRPYTYFSPEQVIQRNPDIIVIGYQTKENPSMLINQRLGWQKIKAVSDKRVYSDINPDILLRPGPRITKALGQLYKKFYNN